jgi:hypothetical protein
LLVAIIVATIIRAEVNPLPAIPTPATIPVRGVAVSERYAKEREVIEPIDEKTPVAETILNAVASAFIEKTSIDESMPAGEVAPAKRFPPGTDALRPVTMPPRKPPLPNPPWKPPPPNPRWKPPNPPPPWKAMAGVATAIAAAITVVARHPSSLVFMS